jgi:hypothetical protein
MLLSTPVAIVCGAIGVFLLGVTLYSGLTGVQTSSANFAPTFVYVVFWLGLVPVSVLFGDVFRAFNPWRAIGKFVAWVAQTAARGPIPPPLAYPERLGRWPAAAALLVFTWIELVSGWGDEPATLVTAAVGYTVLTLAAQAAFGVEEWTRRGEAFAVYFHLLSRLSVWERRERILGVRPPLAGLPPLDRPAGTVAFVAVMIGTVTFDGLSQGPAWSSLQSRLVDLFTGLGVDVVSAPRWAATSGLLAAVALVGGFYVLGIAGARSVGGEHDERALRRAFVHTLVPIAAAYVAAHYLTFLLFEGQAILFLASDPFGQGWDLLGTASRGVDYSLLSANAAWYLQVACVVAGHVAALVLAHDRALALYRDAGLALRSQYWMLAVMVGFTSLALWLLAQAGA